MAPPAGAAKGAQTTAPAGIKHNGKQTMGHEPTHGTITSKAERDALPDGSIVRGDNILSTCVKSDGDWRSILDGDYEWPELPLRVLWIGA